MKKQMQDNIITIPNILTFIRLLLVPFFVWQYVVKKDISMTTLLLVLSGITDVADGFIARRFNMSSDFGKMLDPIADKLTQFAMLGCLLTRFKYMIIPFILIFFKEIISFILSYFVVKKTNTVKGADWHGKVTTVLLYFTIILHVVWADIPQTTSILLVTLCVCMMLISFTLYTIRHINALKKRQ